MHSVVVKGTPDVRFAFWELRASTPMPGTRSACRFNVTVCLIQI